MTTESQAEPIRVVNVDCYLAKRSGNYADERKAIEAMGGELVLQAARSEDEIIQNCAGARIILSEGLSSPISRRVIENLDDCWALGRYGIGVDNIDVDAATDNGIIVFNVADYCVNEVADHAAALVLASARRVVTYDRQVRSGGWADPPPDPPLRRLDRLTLGLVGFGNIGRGMVPRLRGFGMRVIASDPFVDPAIASDLDVELTSLDQVMKESDFVSIHTFLNARTRHLIGAHEIGLMKPTAFLVNTSRGPVVDEEALIEALKERRIGGAALDVTVQEPLAPDSPLRSLDNVILTPHQAAASLEALADVHRGVIEAVSCLIQGYWPPFPFNPKVTPRLELKPYADR
jgi:D-3-phosphoglycerate dehydrogenase